MNKKEWVIRDWGCEVEIANYPLIKNKDLYEHLGFKRNNVESSIVNNVDGFLFKNDPSGKRLDLGGELNSIPFKDENQMFDHLMKLEETLQLNDLNYMDKNSFFNIHITLENDVLDDLKEVGKFCKWIYENHDYLENWITWPFNYKPNEWLWNIHKDTYDIFYSHTLHFNTWKELKPYYACKKGKYDWDEKKLHFLRAMYKRPAINVIQYYQTKTIEFRCFALREMKDSKLFIKFIKQLIQAYNLNDLSVIEKYPKDYKINRTYPYRYKIKETYKDYLERMK